MEHVVASEEEKPATSMNGVSTTSNGHTPARPSRFSWRLFAFVLFIAGLLAAFAGLLLSLAVHAAGSQLHSHILLIPFVTAYLIYIRREQLPNEYNSSPGWATVAALVGLTGLIAGSAPAVFGLRLSHNDYLALMTSSFICLLAA